MLCLCAVDEADVIELEKQYWSLKGTSKSGRFDIETFTAAVSPPMPQELCQGLYCCQLNSSSSKKHSVVISSCC